MVSQLVLLCLITVLVAGKLEKPCWFNLLTPTRSTKTSIPSSIRTEARSPSFRQLCAIRGAKRMGPTRSRRSKEVPGLHGLQCADDGSRSHS